MNGVLPGWAWTTVSEAGEVTRGRKRSPQHHAGDHLRLCLRVPDALEDRMDISDVNAHRNPNQRALSASGRVPQAVPHRHPGETALCARPRWRRRAVAAPGSI